MKSFLHFLTKKKLQHESKENEVIYVIAMKEVGMKDTTSYSSIPKKVTELLNLLDIALVDLPSELLSLHNIQHFIDFMSGSQLPNFLVYHMNPIEYAELKRQVEELLSKGFVCKILSPCVIPVLLSPPTRMAIGACVQTVVQSTR